MSKVHFKKVHPPWPESTFKPLPLEQQSPFCGVRRTKYVWTLNPEEVTCKNCLWQMESRLTGGVTHKTERL